METAIASGSGHGREPQVFLVLSISRPFVSPRYPRSGKHDDDEDDENDDGGGGSWTDAHSHRRVVSNRRRK